MSFARIQAADLLRMSKTSNRFKRIKDKFMRRLSKLTQLKKLMTRVADSMMEASMQAATDGYTGCSHTVAPFLAEHEKKLMDSFYKGDATVEEAFEERFAENGFTTELYKGGVGCLPSEMTVTVRWADSDAESDSD